MADAKTTSVVQLARRWVVDYFNRQDPAAAREGNTPHPELKVGQFLFAHHFSGWRKAVVMKE